MSASANPISNSVPGGDVLSQRFRPYLKFSFDKGSHEQFSPCKWQFFASHCKVTSNKDLASPPIIRQADLAADPEAILSGADMDLRTAAQKKSQFFLLPDEIGKAGESWERVAVGGHGLYCQVEDAGNGQVVLIYWTLYGFNNPRLPLPDDIGVHSGDLTSVMLTYDRNLDRIIRVSFGIHGAELLQSYDLRGIQGKDAWLTGQDLAGRPVTIAAKKFTAAQFFHTPNAGYRTGSRPELYFMTSPGGLREDHLVVFIEWGTHEPWPNPTGSIFALPNHDGTGYSFLPDRVAYLGSIYNWVEFEKPFLYFNGHWGSDPMALPFHNFFYFPNGRAANPLGIASGDFIDADPYAPQQGVPWPP